MAVPKELRVKLLRACIVGGQDGAVGDIFAVSRVQAAILVGDGLATLVDGGRAPYSVTVETPEHGDPAPRKISSGPPQVAEKAAKRE
jgi:hypothetical protein